LALRISFFKPVGVKGFVLSDTIRSDSETVLPPPVADITSSVLQVSGDVLTSNVPTSLAMGMIA
jgi:hypothetical protein